MRLIALIILTMTIFTGSVMATNYMFTCTCKGNRNDLINKIYMGTDFCVPKNGVTGTAHGERGDVNKNVTEQLLSYYIRQSYADSLIRSLTLLRKDLPGMNLSKHDKNTGWKCISR